MERRSRLGQHVHISTVHHNRPRPSPHMALLLTPDLRSDTLGCSARGQCGLQEATHPSLLQAILCSLSHTAPRMALDNVVTLHNHRTPEQVPITPLAPHEMVCTMLSDLCASSFHASPSSWARSLVRHGCGQGAVHGSL